MIRCCGAEEPRLPVCRRQVEPHAQIPRCVDGIGDGTVKSDQTVVALHHFGLGRTIRFQAVVSETSGGKHPQFLRKLQYYYYYYYYCTGGQEVSEIQIGFNFLVLAHPGSPGKRAVKRVCVYYYCTAFNAPRVGHKDDESQARYVRFKCNTDKLR